MPTKTMSVPDAAVSLLMLAEWAPPEGLTATVSSSCLPLSPGRRVVEVALSAFEGESCVIRVDRVPTAEDLAALGEAARQVLEDAWDRPACRGLRAG